MKKLSLFLIVLFIFSGLSGCVYMNVKGPGEVYTTTEYQMTGKDIKVLDRVSTTGETTLWFGMVLTGGKGYQELLEQAKALGGDDVMNYSFDVEVKSVLLLIYSKVQWKATGIAVKYNR